MLYKPIENNFVAVSDGFRRLVDDPDVDVDPVVRGTADFHSTS